MQRRDTAGGSRAAPVTLRTPAFRVKGSGMKVGSKKTKQKQAELLDALGGNVQVL